MAASRRITALLIASTLTLVACGSVEPIKEPPIVQSSESTSLDDAPTSPSDTVPSEEEPSTSDEPSEDETSTEEEQTSAAGTVCGEVTNATGGTLSVVAMQDELTCEEAMEVFTDYFSDSPSGMPPQGSGAFWTAPNGWGCSGSAYLVPGDEDIKSNHYPACGTEDTRGIAFVAVDPERVSELPV
ncbi:hypothetical protein KBP53_04625 [Corynebacterium genitalium ATCC 33030]|uniref:Septum formation-related domain-containing protein n=1 Tax=Corynebacterium genitalium ATCC 33030 TaxID=585529 RepID=D7WDK0_9CORY|nr:hypothetical protein [Corynebacterium genitalium]EFK54231.1 hypothetical protein HMPREF0291_11888 [Corynebacterium genitalium ATCC 33030]UUA90239.1 hypothetical protein KBP53_04625 [Corynebacterium genitalium ATCC 33030]